MSQLDIATLTVLLQANSAQFETQMAQARSAAQREARNISREMRQQSEDSRASIQLLGDAVGVHLPRELRKVISESSLIGPAFAAAFKIGVVGAVAVEVIDLLPKIKSLAEEIGGFGAAAKAAMQQASELNDTISAGFDKVRAAAHAASLIGLQGSTSDQQKQVNLSEDLAVARGKESEATYKALEAQKQLDALRDKIATQVAFGHNPFAAQTVKLFEPKSEDELTTALDKAQKKVAETRDAVKALEIEFGAAGKQVGVTVQKESKDAFDKATSEAQHLKSLLDSISGVGTGALTSTESDPITKIFLERAQRLQEIENKRTSDLKVSSNDRGKIEDAAAVAIISVHAAAARQIAAEYQKAEDSVGQITAELSKLSAFPKLAFPDFSQLVTSGHGVLDVTAERIREITRDTKTLEQATIGYLQQAQNESQKYATDLAAVNAAYRAGLISVAQLNDLTKKLNPNFQRMQQLGQEAARTIVSGFANAVVAGGGVRDILAGILQDLARIILEAALNPLEKSLGGFFGNLLGSFTGGGVSVPGRAGGGSVSAGMPYIVGEHGPELMVPGASGSIVPNGALSKGDTYYIDARGADAGVEQRVMRAIDASRKQAVRESVVTIREQSLRST
jgi:hypothetical protein